MGTFETHVWLVIGKWALAAAVAFPLARLFRDYFHLSRPLALVIATLLVVAAVRLFKWMLSSENRKARKKRQ